MPLALAVGSGLVNVGNTVDNNVLALGDGLTFGDVLVGLQHAGNIEVVVVEGIEGLTSHVIDTLKGVGVE